MLVNRNYINWPFILFFFFQGMSIPDSFQKGFIVKINIRREEKGESKLMIVVRDSVRTNGKKRLRVR